MPRRIDSGGVGGVAIYFSTALVMGSNDTPHFVIFRDRWRISITVSLHGVCKLFTVTQFLNLPMAVEISKLHLVC